MLKSRVNEERSVAVAVDKDKGSQNAMKWATERILTRGQTVTLIHVNQTPSSSIPTPMVNNGATNRQEPDDPILDLFLPFCCFCSRREILLDVVTLQDPDVAKALIEYVSYHRVGTLLLGAPSKNGIYRLFKNDIATNVLKGAPYFCNVYVISKGKIASMRAASRPVPSIPAPERTQSAPHNFNEEMDSMGRATENRSHDEVSVSNTDISFIGSGGLSTDSMFFAFYDNLGSEMAGRPPKSLSLQDGNFDSLYLGSRLAHFNSPAELSSVPQESKRSWSPQKIEEMEEKMRRLEQQMNQTMDMYHTACKEALATKQKVRELQLLKTENENRLEEALRAKEDATATAEKEKEKVKKAVEVARAVYRKAEREAQKRVNAEMEALKQTENKKLMLDSLGHSHTVLRYQSLIHIMVVLFIFYIYFSKFK
uniref:RING-type E3 ubiquitin transferase n=1 Tax=Davidia involucrata TaxID=16924 RepID=A0A5B7A2F8_DAVIN